MRIYTPPVHGYLMVACYTGNVQCRGGTGGGGDRQCSSGLAPAQPASPCAAPGAPAAPSPSCPPPGLGRPPRRGRRPARTAPEVGSGTPTGSAAPSRPRLRAAAGGSVAARAGWRPGVCPGLQARGRRARPSEARRRPGTGAGPNALGPAGRRGAPPRLLRTWARGAGGYAAWLCRRQPGPPLRAL